MKTMLSMCDEQASIVLLSDIDEMRMLELYPHRNFRQYIVNDVMSYTAATSCILRDNADYVCFQEVRDEAVDDLFLVLSSSARVTATLHLKDALLMPQRMIPQKCLLYEQREEQAIHYAMPDYFKKYFANQNIQLNWREGIENL